MAGSDMMVLVVEDEKLQSWSLAKALGKWGFKALPVSTGRDALTQIQQTGYDIILLDYQLPDLDGLEVAKRARIIRPNIVIFLVTAFQLSELPVQAGLINGYFNKPLDLQQLHRALREIPQCHEATPG